MKIPFDIKFRPQIESGEYKVIDRFGYVLTLRDIINDAWYFSLRYPNTDYETERIYDHPENHLFLVTPEPELTEFEEHLKQLLDFSVTLSSPYEIDCIKTEAAELLALARKELEPEVLERLDVAYKNQDEVVYENGKRDGKAEALKDLPRWEKQGYAPQEANIYLPTNELVYHGMAISIDDLTKLPGFKED